MYCGDGAAVHLRQYRQRLNETDIYYSREIWDCMKGLKLKMTLMIVHPDKAYAYDDVPPAVMDIPDSPYEEVVNNILSDSKEIVYVKDYDGVTRAILMSSNRNMQLIRRVNELGIDDYITKPLNSAITRETIHSILHGRSV